MSCIYLVAVGAVERELQEAVRERLWGTFGVTVTPLPALPEPSYALDPRRNQYSSVAVMHELIKLCPEQMAGAPGGGDGQTAHGEARVLGLTERDLFIPMLSFIYGQAQLNGCVGIVSLARLRQEFYGQPPNQRLLLVRLLKEATHEIGHTFGLVHCLDRSCPMSLATNIRQLDSKGIEWCAHCAERVKRAVSKW